MGSKRLNKVIVICGGICSGKTYIANLISKRIEHPVASFGKYLKNYCEKNNLPTDRKTLQDIGEKFVDTIPQKFLNDVIDHFIGDSDTIIIEGVRHISIFELINSLTETKTSIFIEADHQTRYDRYCIRINDSDDFKTFEEFLRLDEHPVEVETKFLKSLCNITIDSTKPLDENLFVSF